MDDPWVVLALAAEARAQTCPLCGASVAKAGLKALASHFETCPKTDREQDPSRKA